MNQKKLPRMLVVDDEALFIRALERVLRHRIEVVGAASAEAAKLLIDDEDFDVVLAEISMTDAAEIRFSDWLVTTRPESISRLILTSAGKDVAVCQEYMARHKSAFLHKPFDTEDLLRAVASLVDNGQKKSDLQADRKQPPKILVVDDDPNALELVNRHARSWQFDMVLAANAMEAIPLLLANTFAIVVCDQMMPRISGVELLTLIRLRWPGIACVMNTACEDVQLAKDVVRQGLVHSFLSKPWRTDQLRSALDGAYRLHGEMSQALPEGIHMSEELLKLVRKYASRAAMSMAEAIDDKESEGCHHSRWVASCALTVGKAMRLDADTLGRLYLGGLLHDVGKIGVPDEVLLKPGTLTDEEFSSIKNHPGIGATFVEPLSLHRVVNDVVLHHHENFDGSGYPKGLSRDGIPLPARIVRLADSYVAMSSKRVYRDALSPGQVKDEVAQYKGTCFDPVVVDAFLQELDAGRMKEHMQDSRS